MQTLTDGILLYYGSYMEVADIDLSKCKKGLDFGQRYFQTVCMINSALEHPTPLHRWNL